MNSETKFLAGIISVTLAIIIGAAVFLGRGGPANNTIFSADVLVKNDSPSLGPSDARVTIVEFSDFECPACKAAHPIIKALLGKYKDKIRFVYRQYPLPSHEFGFLSAQAAVAAGLQDKFWEMHDSLFAKSPDLAKDKLLSYASELGLDTTRFAADLESDAVKQKVLDDQADGNRVGLAATPTFFINGTKFEGVLTLDQFSQEIDPRLK